MTQSQPFRLERSEVLFGRTVISYQVRRSDRRGTLSVAIDPERGVLVTAPTPTSLGRINQIVRDKGSWILQNLRDRSSLASPAFHEFVSGETFHYLGRGCRLKVHKARQDECHVTLKSGWLHVFVEARSQSRQSEEVREAMMAWYRRLAKQRLPEFVAAWVQRLGVEPAAVMVREAPKRWGSCDSKGNLRVNWRIIQASHSLIEYVVVHELTHLKHQHHTSEFWSALGKALPDYERRRAELKRLGPGFVW